MIGGAPVIPEFALEMTARILQRLWHSSNSHPSAAHHEMHKSKGVRGAYIAVLASRRDVGVHFVRADLNIIKKNSFFFIFLLPKSGLAPSLNEFKQRRESIVTTN